MGPFGAPRQERIQQAVTQVHQQTAGIRELAAPLAGKTVTLPAQATSLAAEAAAREALNALVKTDSTRYRIRGETPAAPARPAASPAPKAATPAGKEVVHVLQRGKTLSGIAKQHSTRRVGP